MEDDLCLLSREVVVVDADVVSPLQVGHPLLKGISGPEEWCRPIGICLRTVPANAFEHYHNW